MTVIKVSSIILSILALHVSVLGTKHNVARAADSNEEVSSHRGLQAAKEVVTPRNGIPNDWAANDNEGRYIVKYKKDSKEFLHRLKMAEANEADGGKRTLRCLSGGRNNAPASGLRGNGNNNGNGGNNGNNGGNGGNNGNNGNGGNNGNNGNGGNNGNSGNNNGNKGNDKNVAVRKNFLPKDRAEIIHATSEEEAAEWATHEEVEYVEKDSKIFMMQSNVAEIVPYGINQVQALDIPDDAVGNRKVCIIDSGYDITHPDLASDPSLVTGTTGTAGAWNSDGDGHGTHVAGTIAAIGNNGKGVVGVNRNGKLKLHIVRVFNDSGSWAWASGLVAAVEDCVTAGANIVSMSLGGGGSTQLEAEAYNRILNEDNVLLIAAAGNSGSSAYSYPASYPSVMSVGAVDVNEQIASFSQFNDQVDISAPGVAVDSTVPGGLYAAYSGTSMATPHVSGVAALIWSLSPEKTAKDVWQAMIQTAKDKGAAGRDNYYGYGIVQARDAANLLGSTDFTSAPTATPACVDSPEGWYDSDGPTYSCNWYASGNNCATYGNSYANFGKTANQACCVCGGGLWRTPAPSNSNDTRAPTASPTTKAPTKSPTASPTAKPTKSPTASPSSQCYDSPTGWYDSDGPTFNCAWYSQGTRCETYGDFYQNQGKTANQACCACGGGTNEPPPPSTCVDDPFGWYDSDGPYYNCQWYASGSNCATYGNSYANFGKTANQACCVCGGGKITSN